MREMGVDAMKIGVEIRKVTVFSIRSCYRSVCNHPFLVGFVCFLIFLYRSSPFVFSLLVSASPVLVCTALLLGTLLSFGKPNIPEIENEEKVTTHDIASLKTGVVEDTTVVESDGIESFSTVERYVAKRRDIVENAFDDSVLVQNRVSEVEENGGSVDLMPSIDQNSREIQCEKLVTEEVINDLELEKKREVYEEKPTIEGKLNDVDGEFVVDNLFSNDGNENLEVKDDKSQGELIDSLMEEQLASALNLSWNRAGENSGDDDGDCEESLDSGSDGAESSSPDASMADIIPLLDELHPLLDVEAPQPAHMSHDGSDPGSLMSHKSDEGSVQSEEDTDNQGEEGEGEDDNDDDNEPEGEVPKGENEDESKSAIKWTEADQRNLMDLGNLELERNQRLENLIARRRARKNLRFMNEKNLIDLESGDLPFNIPPIATTRRNPFELPYNSYDDMAIPGSAPSILLPSRNPFDLPYDSSEEKPDLKGDSFELEFTAFQQREHLFRRTETFNVGPSMLGGQKQEWQELKWRPYFVPERYSSEGASYPTFERQLSGISDSKLSSVPDTESSSSAVDEEENKSYDQIPEQFASEGTNFTKFQRQISATSVSVSSAVDEEDKKLNEQDVSLETNMNSNLDHAIDHVELRSQSSEVANLMDIELDENRYVHHNEVEITLGGLENHHEKEPSLSGTGETTTPEELHANERFSGAELTSTPKELNANGIHLKTQPDEEEYSGSSSYTSLSEADEKMPDMREEEGLTSLEPKDALIEESSISAQTSLAESEFQFVSGMLEQREPVFDSSPPALEKFFSFASISSDTQLEISKLVPLLEAEDEESEANSENVEKDTSGSEEMHVASSQANLVDENKSTVREVLFTETIEIEHDIKKVESSGVNPNLDGQKGSMVRSLISDIDPVEEYTVYRGEHFPHKNDQVVSSSHDSGILVGRDVDKKLESVDPGYHSTSSDSNLYAAEGQQSSMVAEHVMVPTSVSSQETELVGEGARDKKEAVQLELDEVPSSSDKKLVSEGMADNDRHFPPEPDQVLSSSLDADIRVDYHQDVFEDMDSVTLSNEHMVSNNLSSSKLAEKQSPLVTGQHPLDKVETHQLEEDQFLSSSGSKIDSDLYQVTDKDVVSAKVGSQDVPSEEKSPSELEKQLSWSDKSPSYDDHGEFQEVPVILMESKKEVNIVNDENVSEIHDHEEKTFKNSSSFTSDSSSTPFESPESRSPGGEAVNILNNPNVSEVLDHGARTLKNSSHSTSDSSSTPFRSPEDRSPGGEDVKDKTLDRVVYGDHEHVQEHLNYSVAAFGHHIDEENINEEADEIKEIDEGFLSELDAVGDFSVKEVVGESIHIKTKPEATNTSRAESLTNDSVPIETNQELPVLEAKSIQDIVLAFKQLDGVEVEEFTLASMLEDQVVVCGSGEPAGMNLDLPFVEARSLEDIHAALKQVSEKNLAEEMRQPLESTYQSLEEKEIISAMQIESSIVESGVQENSATTADKLKHASEEASKSSSLSASDNKKEHASEETSKSSSLSVSDDKKEHASEETPQSSSLSVSDEKKECASEGTSKSSILRESNDNMEHATEGTSKISSLSVSDDKEEPFVNGHQIPARVALSENENSKST